jgi:hypothetical protein
MRSVQLKRAVSIGIAGLIFLSTAQISAESIFRWRNRNGVICYSNTDFPNGVTEVSAMFVAAPEIVVPDADGSVAAAKATMASAPAAAPDDFSGSRMALLMDRIEERRISIKDIETLLKTHPGDAGLRRRLNLKKQYLHEDMIRLKLLAM